tara:strand:+ start:247 stop:2556 length:2310 start_codon:yes stop_codon:yes gene_type:complete
MPSGRLGRCIIPSRTGVELYVNSSGKEASVTIQTQVISTTANAEQTVVVGVAATELRADTIISNVNVGTYKSIHSLNYSCITDPILYPGAGGISTFSGAFKTPVCCCGAGSRCAEYDEGPAHYTFVDPNTGNCTWHKSCGFRCGRCSSCQGCFRATFGGNELQNPNIWLYQELDSDHPSGEKWGYPNNCSCDGWFWAGQIIGWNPGNNGDPNCSDGYCPCYMPRIHGNDDQYLRPAHVLCCTTGGVGVFRTDQAIITMQHYINKCCCCPGVSNGNWPIARYSGCDSGNGQNCKGGWHCNLQFCKYRCYNCKCHESTNCQQYIMGFNWYALCNCFYCCSACTSSDMSHYHSYCRKTATTCWWATRQGAPNCCFASLKCGELMSPMLIGHRWCGERWCCCWGYWRSGEMVTCMRFQCHECGGMNYHWYENRDLCSCHCSTCGYWELLYNTYMCSPCSDCYWKPLAGSDGSWKTWTMSPYGFHNGMTNCFWLHYRSKQADGRVCYMGGWPCACISGGGCRYRCNCYCVMSKMFYLRTMMPTDTAYQNEWPIKYMAFNPFDHYVYMAIRSSDSTQCGIFRVDPDSVRKFHGPHCGCSGCDQWCPGCVQNGTFYPCDTDLFADAKIDWKRVATWPSCWADGKYFSAGSMCVSCLFRSEKCRWVMDMYNHTSGKWDSYSTSDLQKWSLVNDSTSTNPFNLKVNDTLTIKVTDDCRCVISSCNCFMANMDCSGIIDYRFTGNQYERNGIVLSNGDRIMINNNSDEKVNAQIWGYEG